MSGSPIIAAPSTDPARSTGGVAADREAQLVAVLHLITDRPAKVGGGEDPDASGKDQAIGGLGAGPTSLAFEDTELLTEGEKLEPWEAF